jgi:acetyl esterase/lipase
MKANIRNARALAMALRAAVARPSTARVAATPEAGEGWKIGPRTLPPPAGASEPLRKILAAMPAPSALLAPTTLAAWKAFIALGDAAKIEVGDAFIKQHSLKVVEERMAGVRVYRVMPPRIAPEHAHRLFVHVHGGGFIVGNGRAALPEALQIAVSLQMPALTIDYRMPPEHPAPASMDDVVAVWRELVRTHPPATIALGGTSAGATLTLVATLRMKELGLTLPAALFVGTPAADLAKRGDARFINDGIDHTLVSWDDVQAAIALYVGDKSYDDPYISPIFGDFAGFPPTYLISGTRDLLLSDVVRTHRKLRQAGVEADLNVYEGVAHADYSQLATTPECAEHYAELNAFVSRHLAR